MKKISAAVAFVALLACSKDNKDCFWDCHNGDYYPTSQYSESDIRKVETQCGCRCEKTCP